MALVKTYFIHDINPTEEEMSAQREEQEKFYAELREQEKARREADMKLLKENNLTIEDLVEILEHSNQNGPLEIVTEPTGENQDINENEKYSELWCDQWSQSNGESGDSSYYGHLYAKLGENKWLKVPFSC